MDNETRPSRNNWLRSRGGLVLLGFLAIAAFFLFTEHRAHLFGALPYLLLLACILLHLFGHGGHAGPGGHTGHRHSDSGREQP
ncbi:MAG: DUF2933 domain-containing protein [Nitrospirae bacterium]|nr:DUF2933 domain-containing protein [Nitrospirota bacterium]